jgi:2'-5' RNA ligase
MNDGRLASQNLFTLVTYAPEPLSKWLTQLREFLPVAANCQPHITILPPRPLLMPIKEAKQKIKSILSPWRTFEVELSGVEVFPRSNVFYLEVSEGSSSLRRLHAELNAGDLAHEEPFAFHPHLTIGAPIRAEDLEAISRKAAKAWQTVRCACRFEIDEIVFVSIAANGKCGDWRRLWMHNLSTPHTLGRAAGAAITSQTF